MTTTLNGTNQVADFTEKVTSVLMKILEQLLEKFSEAEVPALALPVVKQIFEMIVNNLGGKISYLMQQDETLLIITFQTAAEKSMFNQAMANLKALPQGADASEALKKAKEAMDNLGHFDGWATPH